MHKFYQKYIEKKESLNVILNVLQILGMELEVSSC